MNWSKQCYNTNIGLFYPNSIWDAVKVVDVIVFTRLLEKQPKIFKILKKLTLLIIKMEAKKNKKFKVYSLDRFALISVKCYQLFA